MTFNFLRAYVNMRLSTAGYVLGFFFFFFLPYSLTVRELFLKKIILNLEKYYT
jgi:hypothetical protein